jgi:hypothetical protein
MKKAMLLILLCTSGVVLTLAFGLMMLLRQISLYQMNHARAAR